MEMKFSGQFEVSPPPEKAFDLLSYPQKFAPLLPSFQPLDQRASDKYRAFERVGALAAQLPGDRAEQAMA